MSRNRLAYISATLYALITGLSFLFSKIALASSSPLDLLAFRFTASFIVIVILLVFGLVKLKLNKEKLLTILPLALFYPIFFFMFQAFGLKYATSLEAGILNAIIPVLTLILASLFLKEKTTIYQKISIFMSVAGVIYITLSKGSDKGVNNCLGIILIFLSVASFSSYSVLAKRLTKNFSSLELSLTMNIIGFITFNVMYISNHLAKGNFDSFFIPLKSSKFVMAVIFLGVLSTLCTSLLFNYALSKIDASKMSVFANLATFISLFAGAAILHEKLYYYHLIGSLFIVVGVIGTNFLDSKHVKIRKN